ncbi:MAG: hypothetical protein K1W41_27410 [Lachnospiraceae bacterium]
MLYPGCNLCYNQFHGLSMIEATISHVQGAGWQIPVENGILMVMWGVWEVWKKYVFT